jgi:glycosyltransferase involved in cell wall biosynthesis
VVHVHDLLALRSALGDVPENPTSVTGGIYQRYIRRGFRKASHFISISNKTREDLHRFGNVGAVISEVVHNGLAFPYSRLESLDALRILREAGLPTDERGMLLHVGDGQWYKNRLGIIALYSRYAIQVEDPLPLWFFGRGASEKEQAALRDLPSNGSVSFFQNVNDRTLQAAYSYARAFLFPSLAEGFGWPLIEAQACGCPVITTDEAPMNEVAGAVARYLPRLRQSENLESWVTRGAEALRELLFQSAAERSELSASAIAWAKGFDPDKAIDGYISIYRRVLKEYVSEPKMERKSSDVA